MNSCTTTAEAADWTISNSTTQMENKEKCHKTEQASDLIYQVSTAHYGYIPEELMWSEPVSKSRQVSYG